MTTFILTGLKFLVAFISGSVGVLSEAIHSLLDLISAALSFFTVRHAIKPADDDHPFGHGRFETLSSLFETVLLLVAAGLIINEGIDQLRRPRPLAHEGWAMAVIAVSLVVSYFAYFQNARAARKSDSSALHVNALHFLSDVVASAGVLLGLVLIRVTGWHILDPIMAFAVAVYIIVISLKQLQTTLAELSDTHLPPEEVARIQEILTSFTSDLSGTVLLSSRAVTIEAHDLRTRKTGAHRHVDFHLVVCGHMSVDESHAICDEMESRIAAVLPNTSINIHVEPCQAERSQCESRGCHVQWGTIGTRGDLS